MMDRPKGPPDLFKETCSMVALEVTLLTVVSVNVVFVMDSVLTAGNLPLDMLVLILDFAASGIIASNC